MSALSKSLLIVVVICACLSPLTTRLQAQAVKATVLGTVTDVTGAVVPGAEVLITHTATNFSRTTITNDSGNYVFSNSDPGIIESRWSFPVLME